MTWEHMPRRLKLVLTFLFNNHLLYLGYRSDAHKVTPNIILLLFVTYIILFLLLGFMSPHVCYYYYILFIIYYFTPYAFMFHKSSRSKAIQIYVSYMYFYYVFLLLFYLFILEKSCIKRPVFCLNKALQLVYS